MLNLCLFLFSVFISSLSQIMLKKSASISYANKWKEYLNIRVILSYGIFFIASFIIILAYRKVPLSVGAMIETTGYLWVAILGRLILKEYVNRRKCLGILIVIVGVLISCM